MYAIVKFIDESDAPGIVCSHWIGSDENICKYPNVRTNEARDKLLRKLAQPAHDWISCRIKILRKYSSFNEAQLSLSKAEETSNLESDEETMEKPRKKRRRYQYISEESDSDDCQPAQKRTSSIEPYPIPYANSQNLIYSVPPSPRSVTIQGNREPEASVQCQASTSAPSLSDKPPASFSSQNVMNGKIVAWMADISEKVQALGDKIDLLLKNQAKLLPQNQPVPETSDNNEVYSILGSLPVTDDNSFLEVNKKIAEDSHLRHSFVKVLISVGGKDMRSHIHNMLRRVLTDDVAELYSLSGKSTIKNSSKKSFLATEVSNSIFSACQRTFKDTATEMKVKEAVGDWLNQAKVRKIRRLQRQEKISV